MGDSWASDAHSDADANSSRKEAGTATELCPLHEMEIELLGADGEPVAGEPYEVKVAGEGAVRKGRLGKDGKARLGGLPQGEHLVFFPERKLMDLAEAKTWFELDLQDADGRPVPNERWQLVLPDGDRREGRTDQLGHLRVADVLPGLCRIVFPDRTQDGLRRKQEVSS